MSNISQNEKNMQEEVDYSFRRALRERFDTLLRERGMKYPEFYKPLGMDKVTACRIRNGITIPEIEIQIKIANAFGKISGTIVDTKTIWKE